VSTQALKFIVLRQLSVQYHNLRQHLEGGENPFNFSNWQEFVLDKDRMAKYRDILRKN
jgi:hypothetical protein